MDEILEMIRKRMKAMLPKMSNEGLLNCHKFGETVIDDVLEEMQKRNLKIITVK